MSTSTGDEVALTYEAVDTMLATSAGVTAIVGDRIFPDVAPPDTEYPFVVYGQQSTSDLQGVGPDRIWTEVEMLIRGYAGTDDYEPLRPLAKAIDGAFRSATVTTTGGSVVSAQRIRPFAQREEYETGPVRALGGIYRVYTQSA